jgi:hypothetical protein
MLRLRIATCCIGAALLLSGLATAAALRVSIPRYEADNPIAAYYPQLLTLALEKTAGTDGPFELVQAEQALTSLRQAAELKNNGMVSLIWDSSNAEREKDLLPIRISLLRNLHDYRVLLIRADDARRFAQVRKLNDLRSFTAGAGVNWPSTEALRYNKMPVVTSVDYIKLFPMLRAKRFDYILRGVHAGYDEERLYANTGLIVERTLFLRYPGRFYFFVNKTNTALANRVERGLHLALEDGSFDKLFQSVEDFRHSESEIKSGRRRVIEMAHP